MRDRSFPSSRVRRIVDGMLAAPIQPADRRPAVPRTADLQLRSAAGRQAAQILWSPFGDSDETPPLVVFFGGGDSDADCAACRALSEAGRAVVLAATSVLARDGSWAEAFGDALVMVEWAADHAAELGADPGRIVVAGQGSGARMAAALALHARDRGWPPLARQVLLRPRLDSPAAAGDADGSDAAPLRAPALDGVAPATILGGGPSADGSRYARRLRTAGVEVAVLGSQTSLHDVALDVRRSIEPARS
jgi:acetyl esterase/lipase